MLGSAFYRNKARLRDREDRERQRGDALRRRACSTTTTAGSSLDTALFDPESISVLFELSRAYFMVDMDVPSGYVQFLQTLMPAKPRSDLYTVGRAREAGQDALHPRPAPPPAPLAGRLRRGPRHARPRDARLHAALVPLRDQGDQGRVRPFEALRPRHREAQVPDGQGDRPRRADGRHARVQEPRAPTRPLRARAARPAVRAGSVDDRDRRRQRDRRPLLCREPDDAAQPLPRDARRRTRSTRSCASTATRSGRWRSPTSSPATCSGATSASTGTAGSSSTTTTRSST